MKSNKYQSGFIIVEFIISLILIGIIGVFTSLFIYTGVKGYMDAKNFTETALKAQVALVRIRMELRDIEDISIFDYLSSDPYITYTSEILTPGSSRTIKYHSEEDKKYITIQIDAGLEHKLLRDVSSFTLAMGTANLDGIEDGPKEEISNIGITFQIGDIGKVFQADVYPRNMLEEK